LQKIALQLRKGRQRRRLRTGQREQEREHELQQQPERGIARNHQPSDTPPACGAPQPDICPGSPGAPQ
jgi:hypothetical protein